MADRFVKKEKLPPHWAGLKFFNVFGPNEYHKGHMASVLSQGVRRRQSRQPVKLFKSHRDGIADGDQRRDFIYVDDAVAVMRWLLDTPRGQRHFQCRHRQGGKLPRHDRRDVQGARAARPTSNISTCRTAIRGQYQYFTQAEVENLRRAGYNAGFTPLEDAVARYVTGYLDRADRYR